MIDLDKADLAKLEAVLETDKGTMVLGFNPEQAPNHVRNFLDLAQKGFYDGLAFHRVVRNFMVQGGCPHSREGVPGSPGTGGPGYTIDAEFSDLPHNCGTLSMARAQEPNSAGSQFFIVHAEHAEHLDGKYTVFGRVVQGLDVLDELASVEVEFAPGGERSRPVERMSITRIAVREAAPEIQVQEKPAPETEEQSAAEDPAP